jgi:glycosyltransferase involved in cell wall biosynthesis
MQNKPVILFLSYNGLLEPILPSQALPYMKRLAASGYRFILLTFEKKADLRRTGRHGLAAVRNELNACGIEWRYLKYHKNPPVISTVFDLLRGAIVSLYLAVSRRVNILHVRGVTPGIITILISGMIKAKIVFDMRGLLAEEYVGGGLWKEGGMSFNLVKRAEKRMLEISDAVVVLTNKHLELNRTLGVAGRDVPMEVVPCCVDTDRFRRMPEEAARLRRELGLGGAFVLMYPGKIGTFYLVKEMVDFFKVFAADVPDAVLLIVTNDDAGPMTEHAVSIGVDARCMRVLKGVPFEDMPRYTNIADDGLFFINPYKKIGSSPIKLGEFLACGVPVMINPGVGDTEEIVRSGRAGVVVNDLSDGSYRKASAELADMMKEGEGLKERCRQTAKKYLSLEIAVEKYAKIYDVLSGIR